MEWIDSHCHIDHRRFDPDREAVLRNARALGMRAMLVPAIRPESNAAVRQIPSLNVPWVRLAVGVHPNHVTAQLEKEDLLPWLDHRAAAIGETGLDYFRTRDPAAQAVQREKFRLQLELALEYGLSVVLHIRDAWEDAMHILQDYPGLTGVAHCFNADLRRGEWFWERGFALGIGALIRKAEPGLTEAVRAVPDHLLLLETDAPFLWDKGRNTPEHIPAIAEAVAQVRGCSTEEIMLTTTKNAERLFRFPTGGTHFADQT